MLCVRACLIFDFFADKPVVARQEQPIIMVEIS